MIINITGDREWWCSQIRAAILFTRHMVNAIKTVETQLEDAFARETGVAPVANIFVAAVIELKDVIHGAIFELKIEPWNFGACTSIYTLPYLGRSVSNDLKCQQIVQTLRLRDS